MDDINPEQQLTEEIKHCQKTARNLNQEYESLLQKQKRTNTANDSDHPVKATLANDAVTKRLKDIDLALESIRQQLKLALEQYLTTQSDLSTSADRPMIQSHANQKQIAKVTRNEQVKLLNDNNGQNEVNLNPIVHALFTGTLPDDFFLHLLSVIGIQECLISNRLVCSLWNELVLERCSNQKSLKLFETFEILMNYGEMLLKYEKTQDTSLILKSIGEDLLFEGLEIDHEQLVNSLLQDDDEESDIPKEALTRKKKLEASKVLTALFPRVEDLVLCTELHTLINIEHLLQFYAEQLTSLTMNYFGPWREDPGCKLRAFSFPKLTSLNIFNFAPEEDQLLSLLPQLELLTLESAEISLETLLRTGTQLRELNIHIIQSVYTSPAEDFSKRPPINSNLRKFTFGSTLDKSQVHEFISQNMTSLEYLKLDLFFDRNNVYSHLHLLSPFLAPLQQLHSLTLEAPVSFFLLDDTQLAEVKPLPSVRHLKLLLWDYDSLPRESMDLFSRALFTAFPNAEQALIAFVGHVDDEDLVNDGLVDANTLAAFEDFAGKHPNVVQLFRSGEMSRLTNLPNVISPLLGQHRQVYEEYIEEEELFGVTIGKLTASLVSRQGEEGPNLKSALRPADRLSAMSNLLQLLESGAFAFTDAKAKAMIKQMVKCALKYDLSEGTLYIITSKCVLFLLDSSVDTHNSDKERPFLYSLYSWHVYTFFEILLKLVKHYQTQQYDDKSLFLQLCKRIVELLTEFDSIRVDDKFDDFNMLKIFLKLANYYKTQQLNVHDPEEELLLQIDNLVDDQLQMFESENRLDRVIRKLIGSKYRVYRIEIVRAMLRCCESTDNYFNLLSGEAGNDSSEGDSSDSDGSSSSAED